MTWILVYLSQERKVNSFLVIIIFLSVVKVITVITVVKVITVIKVIKVITAITDREFFTDSILENGLDVHNIQYMTFIRVNINDEYKKRNLQKRERMV